QPPILSGLAEEFPDARPDNIGGWRPVLEFYGNLTPELQKRVSRPEGTPFRDAGLVARNVLLQANDPRDGMRLSLLKSDPNRAQVALYFEPAERRVPGGKLEKTRRLSWTVQLDDAPKFRRMLMLRKHDPLKPLDEP